jgi:hypothetical protein
METNQQNDIRKLQLPQTVDGVYFSKTSTGELTFSYSNAIGTIYGLGAGPTPNHPHLHWRLSCRFSDDDRFNLSFEPGLGNAAKAIKESWNKFCNGV